jgi:hypothetical protein
MATARRSGAVPGAGPESSVRGASGRRGEGEMSGTMPAAPVGPFFPASSTTRSRCRCSPSMRKAAGYGNNSSRTEHPEHDHVMSAPNPARTHWRVEAIHQIRQRRPYDEDRSRSAPATAPRSWLPRQPRHRGIYLTGLGSGVDALPLRGGPALPEATGSSNPGSRPTMTAWTTWTGCGSQGLRVPAVRADRRVGC